MTRRLSLALALGTLCAVFALPGSAAAANPWRAHVKIDHCQFTGGANGHGYMELKVKAVERGMSGTTQIVVLSERQESSGVGFSTTFTYPKDVSMTFPNDGSSYFHVLDRRYDFTKNDELTQRFVFTVKFKSSSGHTLQTINVTGSSC